MSLQPSNEPSRYDRRRVATFAPVEEAVQKMRLPALRARKPGAICNAIEVQIEDGGDSPEVDDLLLDALRAAVIHQIGEKAAAPVLRAIEAFRRSETARWEQIRSGIPLPVPPEDRLDDLIDQGRSALEEGDRRTACDRWLAAWEIVKQLTRPEIRDSAAFDVAFPHTEFLLNWAQDLMFELHNLGLDERCYQERRRQCAREFLTHFPDESANTYVNFRRAEGEALWALDRRSEAEAVYAALVERFPDEAWGYIGWADQYWLWQDAPQDYARAEAILTRALARPRLRDRDDLVQRLGELYARSGQINRQSQLEKRSARSQTLPYTPPPDKSAAASTGLSLPGRKPGRNDPCWCGSGKKYKRCHLGTDPE
jgi:tetratricopeptide (TPR) repeat protein